MLSASWRSVVYFIAQHDVMNYTNLKIKSLPWAVLLLAGLCSTVPVVADTTDRDNLLNIYSARKEQLIKPLLDQFSANTGIKINLVTGKADALLARLKTEGKNTPADVLLTTDVGRLHHAHRAGLLQTVNSDTLRNKIPSRYRDPANHWFGLSLRARVFMVSDTAYRAGIGNHLKDYEDLADPRWKGKICIRSSSNIYNQSLVASLIENIGAAQTLDWAKKLTGNFARQPTGGDRDQILAAAGGLCDIAVANTYYLAMMLNGNNDEQRKAAQSIHVIWPNQSNRGAHINISGIGVTTHAANRSGARALAEFLVGDAAQQWYARVNNEFPVVATAQMNEDLFNWSEVKHDAMPLARLGELNIEAVKLMDKSGWR